VTEPTPPKTQQPHDDIHDIAGLLLVHRYLFASQSERARLIADVVA